MGVPNPPPLGTAMLPAGTYAGEVVMITRMCTMAALSPAVDAGNRSARLASPTTVEGRRRLNSN